MSNRKTIGLSLRATQATRGTSRRALSLATGHDSNHPGPTVRGGARSGDRARHAGGPKGVTSRSLMPRSAAQHHPP